MMTSAPSLSLRRLRFVLKTDDAQAVLLQDRVSALFAKVIRSDLDAVGEAFSGQMQETRSLDKVVLNLGDFSSHALERELPQRLRTELTRRLAELLPQAETVWAAEVPPQSGMGERSPVNPAGGGATQPASTEKPAPEWTQLSVFLRDGYFGSGLAASSAGEGLSRWLQRHLTALANTRDGDHAHWHRVLIHASLAPAALQRLLSALSPAVLMQLADFLLADPQTLYVTRDLPQWQRFLPLCAAHGARLYADIALPNDAGWWRSIVTALPAAGVEAEVLAVVRHQNRLPPSVHEVVEQALSSGAEEGQASANIQQKAAEQSERARPKTPAIVPEVLPVSNAGICLLWPLLPHLFTALGLLQEKTFADDAARLTAVCRLDYLIWGGDAYRIDADNAAFASTDGEQSTPDLLSQEWRATLNKILCGLPLDAVIDPWTAPTLEEQAAMQQWLLTAVKQIPALHRLSENDLRELFLQRPGQLVKVDGRWKLEVESEAADALLSTDFGVPWPMNYLMLPWLEQPLEVTWF